MPKAAIAKDEDCADQEYPDDLQAGRVLRPMKGKKRQYDDRLRRGKEHTAHRLADYNREPRDWRDEYLLHKAEFLVPYDRNR